MKASRFFHLVMVIVLVLALLPAAQPAFASKGIFTIAVNSSSDAGDLNPGDHICDASAAIGEQCTLRAAIQEANLNDIVNDQTTLIQFDGDFTFTPATAYDALNSVNAAAGYHTHINGGAHTIILDGSGTPAGFSGLRLSSNGHTIQGLTIRNFRARGILVESNNNLIGSDGDGDVFDYLEGNTIIQNQWEGIAIYGDDNHVGGNYIGIDSNNTAGLGNLMSGIFVDGDDNIIGVDGSDDGYNDHERNIISGNGEYGILVSTSGFGGQVIAGNYIGTTTTGNGDRGNDSHGIYVDNGITNSLTRIGTNSDGVADLAERNVISGNGGNGIQAHSGGLIVRGNYIGVTSSGASVLGNDGNGVQVMDAITTASIGTNADGVHDDVEGNLISGNGNAGINVMTNVNFIAGNKIGVNADGDAAIPNGFHGIILSGAGNRVGVLFNVTDPGVQWTPNLISGNTNCGVYVLGEDADGNLIRGNFIGVNAAQDDALPNTTNGVCIQSGADNTVIGAQLDPYFTDVERNLIAGNGRHGVYLAIASNSSGTRIVNNYLGLTGDGLGNISNSGDGIQLASGSGTQIKDNVIGYNTGDAIDLRNTSGNTVFDNFLGVHPTGAALSNGGNGVYIGAAPVGDRAVSANEIQQNTIAYNEESGIYVESTAGPGQYFTSNQIYWNGLLGIDLAPAGVTPNDVLDADSGPNDLLNFPVLTLAHLADPVNGMLTFAGELNSLANHSFRVDFYASQGCDPGGHGEGQIYVVGIAVNTDDNGVAQFNTNTFFPDWRTYQYFTSVTVDLANNSVSEFSACVALDVQRIFVPLVTR